MRDTPALALGLVLLLLRGHAHRLLPAPLRWVLVARPLAHVEGVQLLSLRLNCSQRDWLAAAGWSAWVLAGATARQMPEAQHGIRGAEVL